MARQRVCAASQQVCILARLLCSSLPHACADIQRQGTSLPPHPAFLHRLSFGRHYAAAFPSSRYKKPTSPYRFPRTSHLPPPTFPGFRVPNALPTLPRDSILKHGRIPAAHLTSRSRPELLGVENLHSPVSAGHQRLERRFRLPLHSIQRPKR